MSLKYWHADGSTSTGDGFTKGTSADGDRQAISLDGTATASPSAIDAVSFENWWGQQLSAVQQLKISTQEPLTGGSPRISIETGDSTGAADGDVLYLDPNYCNSSNSNGWRTSNWRGDQTCVVWDAEGRSYAGWNAMVASPEHASQTIYYAFVIQDQPLVSRVDRITLDSKVFTKN